MGQGRLQGALCILLTFGDLEKFGFGLQELALRALAWVGEPGSTPGSFCAQTGPSLFLIVARREPSAACAPGTARAPRASLAELARKPRVLWTFHEGSIAGWHKGSQELP